MLTEDSRGRLKIFHNPNPSHTYAIGADVALGIDGGDYSTAFVIDKDLRQCASWHGHIDPDLFGKMLCRLGEHYNKALLAPEVNNMGHTTLSKIKELGYGNLYTRFIEDERADKRTKKLGWQTNTKTKMDMLNGLVSAYRDGLIEVNDLDLLKEMLTLTIDPDGDVNLNGKDRVVSACIALEAIKQAQSDKFKAIVPETRVDTKNFKTLEEKIKYYENKRKRTQDSYF